MQTPITLIVFEPLIETVFMELVAAFALDHFTGDGGVGALDAVGTDSLELVLADRTCLTL